ncbi:AAA-domain-containing protein [Boletus reticuloceps]|uniref:AAA-domain-containing protein n=1 Tax=Boletus reticuloceps TaxID=495285 RepID=A0A8I2YQ94_9AGAM|nr:AAA-domain-containing protein [Boletus reticuloceps]
MTTGNLPLRRSGRNRTGSVQTQNSPPSTTSEYHGSERSVIDDNPSPTSPDHVIKQEQWGRSLRGRKVKRSNYKESGSEDDIHGHGRLALPEDQPVNGKVEPDMVDEDDEDDEQPRRPSKAHDPSQKSYDADGSLEDALHTSSDLEADADAEGEPDFDAEGEPDLEVQDDGRPYSLRQRVKINYAIPPPIEETKPPPKNRPINRSGARARRGPGWSATGAELSRWMGMPVDDSDSDVPTRTPKKGLGTTGGLMGAGAVGAGGASVLPGELAAVAGTPSNLGKIGDSVLADTDPLGVNQNVTFDEVGGLDERKPACLPHIRGFLRHWSWCKTDIHSLKEMTVLPLLYPEVFQRFSLTPPRGVLFHGPPGTGKTLLARALAASCRANGKGISFFMRKGADCLSKWVGEAERQLRLLFEEARNCQPSIIFFDEIDGLAPVRSSKQDQIHASIVSTLLALMDGMDGRGQVVVIGATNRPDAIDPALRRPGRFDREFYFPLPSFEAREKILGIMTRKWEGWTDEQGKENIKGLAKLTKGYGGADLRALCTEAALNAIQRRYPQIYQSNDRLLLKPETIGVSFRDFMISVKKLVPSSARSSSSAASPLPSQLEPLLADTLQMVREAINKVMPASKKRTALEEAQWEDDSEESALEREMMMQSMETLRVYRPRLLVHGQPGMGQGYVGAAALHYLEGYHIQNLDLGTLMGDSTRTVEAAIVQLFVEAKRHQPSVIYIPSLLSWCAAVHETARTTVRTMLDTLAPTDPVLLLAYRRWIIHFPPPRCPLLVWDNPIIADVRRPPNQFADGIKRKRRVLEELQIAPPPEPRQPTAAELATQEENDQRIITLLKYRLGPILTELKRKFKRFTKKATVSAISQVMVFTSADGNLVSQEEYRFELPASGIMEVEIVATDVTVDDQRGVTEVVEDAPAQGVQVEEINGTHPEFQHAEPPASQLQAQTQLQVQPPIQPQLPPLYDMDLERMHMDLYKGKYLTPHDFLDDIHKIVHNAASRMSEDGDRFHKAQAMLTAAEVSMHEFDPHFRLECQRIAERERKRKDERKKAKEKNCASEAAQNGTYAPGTRRSARHTGQQPEMSITDPLQLERRLKRARTGDRPSGSPESGEENKAEDSETPVQPKKRPRTMLSDDDELDLIGSAAPQRSKTPIVRFVDEGRGDELPVIPEPTQPTTQPPSIGAPSDAMTIDSPVARRSGFDPFLLNPLPPEQDMMRSAILVPLLDGSTSSPGGSNTISPTTPQQNGCPETPVPLHTTRQASRTPTIQPLPVPDVLPVIAPPREPTRSPTPLPDFHVNEGLLLNLQSQLKTRTSQLTIEQLEQLRATCLNSIWHHRTEWDRDGLVQELSDVLNAFLEDCSAGMDDVSPGSPADIAY